MFVVMRSYVKPDGSFSAVFAESVADTLEQAIGDAAKRAAGMVASVRGARLGNSDRRFSVYDGADEIRYTIQEAAHLDSSNYKPA